MNKILDLFSGVGGLSLGFEQAGFEVAMANEIDKDIASAYRKNRLNTHMVNEDITQLDYSTLFQDLKGKITVVIGGPPCQGFSQKGSRNFLGDERNFLFKQFYEVVKYLKPKYFLIENVPNLLTSNKGFFKDEIYRLFEAEGYQIDSAILNAYEFGVPQLRRRAFILGKLGGEITLPLGTADRVSVKEAISDLAFLDSGQGENVQEYLYPTQSEYQRRMRNKSLKLVNHVATKHSELALERLKLIPPEMGKEVLPQEHLTKSIYSGTWSRMIEDEPAVTITTRFDTPSSGRFTHPFLNRAITVREAARLQSFPDDFVFYGSKTSQMKQVGNAVPPLLAQAIAEVIMNDIKSINGVEM
ncbi:DNA cytosine methyltransferase [Bacillus cereus]|uniref:DNA cytosine methyltransferase n=1 Tax=Bacillus cereus TaxID=1396 RepID=UPI002AC118D6|nr:DNA cytosine methyltransferase [Bacillus cereus]MCU5529344.1 DNA cytosine methyltransferase [Bacillus cereus]MDZ4481602.1 DNA cytosine methyltransferase [Bacillus cereus]